jgi:hypothetical protein
MVLIQYFLDNYRNVFYTTTRLVTMVDHDKKIYDDYPNQIGILRIVDNCLSSYGCRTKISHLSQHMKLI